MSKKKLTNLSDLGGFVFSTNNEEDFSKYDDSNNQEAISNNEQYTQFGYPVYEDLIKEKGPLAGIYTGLSFSRSDKNVVLSCDVPFVNSTIINLLINNCKDFDVVIPEKNKRTHQMIGIYDKSCVNSFKNQLKKDQLKLKLAVEKMNFKTVDANQIDDKIFRNINSKNDIEA